MKTIFRQSIIFMAVVLLFFSCEKINSDKAPQLPPVETMVPDFSKLATSVKGAVIDPMSKINWTYSVTSVGIWNLILATTLAVPVASFKAAFGQFPVKVDDNIWQWTYSVDGFTSKYSARLVGEKMTNEVKWKMYIKKEGIDPFNEFLWFEGASMADGNSGQWKLNHTPQFPEELILINWKKEGEKVNEIKYSYTRKLKDNRETDKFNGSYLIYGLKEKPFDAYVTIHAFNDQNNSFTDSFVEWSTVNYSGRIKSEYLYKDNNWHCWDSSGNDIVCN